MDKACLAKQNKLLSVVSLDRYTRYLRNPIQWVQDQEFRKIYIDHVPASPFMIQKPFFQRYAF